MARIITVYSNSRKAVGLTDMSFIRWYKMSEALARLGHEVDIATAEFKWRLHKPIVPLRERLRRVPLETVNWDEYDVVKTLFHEGFTTLERYGGADHPFIIAKLGSVVGERDREGIYFYGEQRARMFEIQRRIHERARYVTLLSEPARKLWAERFGKDRPLLLVPGAVDRTIPPRGADPYPTDDRTRCVFAGNFYVQTTRSQTEAHRNIACKLNMLGELLDARNARLYVVGPGDESSLDARYVSYCGTADYERSWDYLHHAHVGVLVSAGRFMHNNESTKIYHYLRAGLPTVSESGFPNDRVIHESELGYVVENGNLQLMARKILEAAGREWDRRGAIEYVLANHTWDARAAVYEEVLAEQFAVSAPV